MEMVDKYQLKKFEARAPDEHHTHTHTHTHIYIYIYSFKLIRAPLFVWLFKLIRAPFFFFLNDFRIVSHSPFACNWQNKLWDSEPIVACFLSNKGGNSNIGIPQNSSVLHLAPCMRDVCCVHRLGLSRTSKQNVLSLILLIPLAKLINQKKRHL